MQEATLEEIYRELKGRGQVDLTQFLREEHKEYIDSKGNQPDKNIMSVVMEISGMIDPTITISKFRKEELVESHFYYLDQKNQLRELLKTWLNV